MTAEQRATPVDASSTLRSGDGLEALERNKKKIFDAYSEYQEANVEWLGSIPAHWRAVPLKRVAFLNPDTLPETTASAYELLYVDIGNVGQGRIVEEPERYRFADAPTRARRRVSHGDTIISTVRTYLRAISYVDRPADNLIVSTGFAVLRPRSGVHPEFLTWLLQSHNFIERVVANSVGVGYPAIAPNDLVRLNVCLPPVDEQRAIAAFLDRETAKIDALIEKKKRLQDRLREKRATETFSLVTKSVRSVRSFRDSGVEWIGDIPEHWSRARLLHVCRLETGHTPARDREDYWQNCTIPWVTLADVHQLRSGRQEYINGTSEKISELGLAHSAARLLPKNTVILSRTASVGFAGIIPEPMATSQDFVNWICGPFVEPRYLVRCLWAMKDEFRRLTMGSTHQTIYMPDVKGLTIPLPPVEEQNEIVAESEKRTGWVARLNDKLTEQIQHLREYRTALISAAVTGQIDVRGRV